MSIETPKNSEKNKEEFFQSWLAEFQGRLWLNPDAMPEGVYDTLQTYTHFKSHRQGQEEKADNKMEGSVTNFKKLTNYDIQDFFQYQDEQNQKLKTDKK